MLQHRAVWRSTSQRRVDGRRSFVKTTTTNAENGSSSILSRLSNRTQPRAPQALDADSQHKTRVDRTPRPRATFFISTRSAQKRDHAAAKWFTDVRELDISNVDQPKSLPRKRRSDFLKPHEMRPKTDLNALFAPSAVHSAVSLRLQTKKELGGDYTSYLPDGYADPYRLPVAYARLVLGRNKHIPLRAQTAALNIVEKAVQGKITRQVV